jgi:hypothetical protein
MILVVCEGLICRTRMKGGTTGKVIAAITTSVDGYIVGPKDGVADISHLVGHANTRTTEKVYRKGIAPRVKARREGDG